MNAASPERGSRRRHAGVGPELGRGAPAVVIRLEVGRAPGVVADREDDAGDEEFTAWLGECRRIATVAYMAPSPGRGAGRVSVGVLDHEGILDLFRHVEGRRLLGVVDCPACLELVFDDAIDAAGNLVTLYTDSGSRTGLVAFGLVSDPETYVGDWNRWIEEAA